MTGVDVSITSTELYGADGKAVLKVVNHAGSSIHGSVQADGITATEGDDFTVENETSFVELDDGESHEVTIKWQARPGRTGNLTANANATFCGSGISVVSWSRQLTIHHDAPPPSSTDSPKTCCSCATCSDEPQESDEFGNISINFGGGGMLNSYDLIPPTIGFVTGLPDSFEGATELTLTPVVGGVEEEPIVFDPDDLSSEEQYRFNFRPDSESFGDGVTMFSANFKAVTPGGERSYAFTSGTTAAKQRSGLASGMSLRGAGWLTMDSSSAVLRSCCGDRMTFSKTSGGDYVAASGDTLRRQLTALTGGGYSIKDKYGAETQFNAAGLPVKELDPKGNTRTYTYVDSADADSDAHELASVVDSNGEVTTYTYNSGGLLETITDPAGLTYTYTYDSNGYLEHVISPDPDGAGPLSAPQSTLTWDSGQLTSFTDPAGNVRAYEYDAAGRVAEVRENGVLVKTLQSNLSQGFIDREAGVGTSTSPAPLVEPTASSVKNAFDKERKIKVDRFFLPTEVENELGEVTKYERNADGQVSKFTGPDPDGPGGQASPVIEYQYDDNANLTRIDYPDGTTELWSYDEDWNIPTMYTDRRGFVTLYEIDAANGDILSIRELIGDNDLESEESDDVVTTFTYTSTPAVLQVSSIEATATGVEVTFNRQIDASDLNLYDYRDSSNAWVLGSSDVTLVGSGVGAIPGSLIVRPGERTFVFVSANGLLPADTYTLTLRSATNGFKTRTGELLDGDADGDAGGNFVETFSVSSSSPTVVSIPDFARGPLQSVNVPATDTGIPVKVTNSTVVSTMNFEFAYDPRILSVTDIALASGMPSGSALTWAPVASGRIHVWITFGSSGLASGFNTVARITASIPSVAATRYGSSGLLDIRELQLFNSSSSLITAVDDDGVQVAAYYGEVSGNGSYDSIDTTLVSRHALNLDTGFASFPLTNPRLLADFNGNATLDSFDTQRVSRLVADLPIDEAPAMPSSAPSTSPPPPPPLVHPVNGLIQTVTDAEGRVTQFEYDYRGNVIRTRFAVGTAVEAETRNVYDPVTDLLLQSTDELGRTTTYTYDGLHRVKTITQPDPDAGGPLSAPVYTYDEYDALGRPLRVLDPLGRATEYEYDDDERTYRLLLPDHDGDGQKSITTYQYDEAGRLLWVTDALGRKTEYGYTFAGQLETTTLPDPDGAEAVYASPILRQFYDHAGAVQETQDGLERSTLYPSFDFVNRTQTVYQADPDGTSPFIRPTTVTTYDPNGNAVSVLDPLNRLAATTYDRFNRPLAVLRPDADTPSTLVTTTVNTYDKVGNLLSTTDSLGNVTLYEYDARNRRISVTEADPDGVGPQTSPVTTYAFDDANQLVSVTDARGKVTTYGYDRLGRQTSVTLPDPDGAAGPQLAPTTTYAYDAVGRMVAMTDPRLQTTNYEYDLLDHRIAVIEPDADGIGAAERPTTHYRYDAVGQLLSVRDPLDRVTTYEYDRLGRQTAVSRWEERYLPAAWAVYELNASGSDSLGQGPALTVSSTYTATLRGQGLGAGSSAISTATPGIALDADLSVGLWFRVDSGASALAEDKFVATLGDGERSVQFILHAVGDGTFDLYALGDTTRLAESLTIPVGWHHFGLSRLGANASLFVDGVAVSTGAFSLESSAPATGIGLDVSGSDGAADQFILAPTAYSATYWTRVFNGGTGRAIVEFSPPTIRYTYDAAGNLLTQTDSLDNVTTYEYDDLNRRTKIIAPDDNPSDSVPGPTTQYAYNAAGELVSVTDPMNRTETNEFYFNGWLKSVTRPDPDGEAPFNGLTTSYTYDDVGNLKTTTDPLGNVTTNFYDNLHRLLKTEQPDPDGSSTTLAKPTTLYSYDAVGNRLSLTDPVGNTTAWAYDALNRVTSQTNQLGAVWNFQYDANGNLVRKTDRLGRSVSYEYDYLNRRTAEHWAAWSFSTLDVGELTYTYDLAGQLTSAATSHTRDGNAYSTTNYFSYDNLGRVISETQNPGLGAAVHFASVYDANGNRTSLQGGSSSLLPDFRNEYVYDGLNRLTQLTQTTAPGGSSVVNKRFDFAYNLAGQFDSIQRFYDLAGTELIAETSYEYDAAGRLTDLTHFQDAESPLARYQFEYDAGGRITEIDSLLDGVSTYGYDNTSQLTNAVHDFVDDDLDFEEDYSFDENGNRTMTGHVVGPNNQLLSDGEFVYTYDAEGNRSAKINILTGERTDYVWDHRNRLIRVLQSEDANGLGFGNGAMSSFGGGDGYDISVSNSFELNGWAWLNVTVDEPLEDDLEIEYWTELETAVNGVDYTLAPGTLTLPSGHSWASIGFPIHNDSIAEGGETFILRYKSALETAANKLVVSIEDNDCAGPSSGAGQLFGNASGTASVGVSGSAAFSGSSASVNGSGLFQPNSFQGGNSGEIFVKAAASAAFSHTSGSGDGVTVELSNAGEGAIGAIAFSLAAVESSDVVIEYWIEDDTATAGDDFEFVYSTATILAGYTTSYDSFTIFDDSIVEGMESFTFHFRRAGTSDDFYFSHTIDDNEAWTTDYASMTAFSATEGDIVYIQIYTPYLPYDVEVTASYVSGSADVGDDLPAGSWTFTIPAYSWMYSDSLATYDDVSSEGTESFQLRLQFTGENALSDPFDLDQLLFDDEEPDYFLSGDFSATATTGIEGDDITLTIDDGFWYYDREVTVWLISGSATAGDDFTGEPFYFTIPAATWGQTFTIPTYDDSEAEGTETFTLRLQFTGSAISDEYDIELELGDDDLTPVDWTSAWFTAEATSGREGEDIVVGVGFGTYDSKPLAEPAVVKVWLVPDVAGYDDFTSAVYEIEFPVGVAADFQTIRLPTFADSLPEGVEHYIVRIQWDGEWAESEPLDIELDLLETPLEWDRRIDYFYDHENRLVVRQERDGDTPEVAATDAFYYDDKQIVLKSHDGQLVNRLVWGPQVDMLLADEQLDPALETAAVLYPLNDHLGTTRDLAAYDEGTGETSIASHRVFDTFGNLVSETDSNFDTEFKFTGRYFDEATEQQWNLNRWYDPMTGQWLSEDPLTFFAGDSNLKRYVGHQVLSTTDPAGLFGVSQETRPSFPTGHPDPSVSNQNKGGAQYIFIFEDGDLPHVLQHVEVTGTFTLRDTTGKVYKVEWKESFDEAWATPIIPNRGKGGGKRWATNDVHRNGPARKAKFLEEQLNLNIFYSPDTNKPTAEPCQIETPGDMKSRRDVLQWSYKETATFTATNVEFTRTPKDIFMGNHTLEVKLIVDGAEIATKKSEAFNASFAPTNVKVDTFPAVSKTGKSVTSTETWSQDYDFELREKNKACYPKSKFEAPGYK